VADTLNLAIQGYKIEDLPELASFAAQRAAITYFVSQLQLVNANIAQTVAAGVTDPVYANVAAAQAALTAVLALYVDEDGNAFDPTIGTVIP
jgi:hypothetical protein